MINSCNIEFRARLSCVFWFRTILVFFLNIVDIFSCAAQFPAYIHYDMNNGMPSNLIYCGYVDKRGVVWFGTYNGLVRFDNNKFKIYSTDNGLPDSEVLNIWEDSFARLWVSCFRKKPCYLKDGKIVTNKHDSLLNMIDLSTGICTYHENKKKQIFFLSSSSKVYLKDSNGIKMERFPDAVFDLHTTNGFDYAIATTSVILYDEKGKRKVYKFEKSKTDDFPLVSAKASGNYVLYSFKNITYLLEIRKGGIHLVDSIQDISGKISLDNKNRFWLCSPANGAICFSDPSRGLAIRSVYLPGKKTTSMFEDKQGNYWFCTMDDGIYCLPASAPAILDKRSGLPSNSVTSVSLGINDQIYAGDDEGNFSEIKKGVRVLGKIKSTDGYNRVLDILDANDGKTWIATDEGVYLKDKYSIKKTKSTNAAPKAIVLEEDKAWCGTSSGLYFLSSESRDTISSFQFAQRVTALAKDQDGNLWTGGIEGLYCSSDTFKYNWGQDFANLKTRIVSIKIDEKNKMWVATPDSGLICGVLEKGVLKRTITINKLLQSPIRNIQSIFIENPETIWLATNNGIHALNTQNWSVRHLDHFDGLANDDVRSLVVRNDSLWAATSAGVSLFALKPNHPITSFSAYITMLRYRADENTVAFDLLDSLPAGKNEIVLPSNAALIEISFAGLDYRRKGTPYFECETMEALLPFKWWTKENLTNWLLNKFIEKKRVTKIFKNYLDFGVNLAPGRYHIQLVAIGSDGQQRSLPDNCFFILPPKWYQTIWVSLLIWFAIAYAIFKLYQANVKLREMAIAVAQSRLVALQAQINPHFIGNTVNAVQRFFYPPNPVGSSTYTATFTRLLRRTLNFSEQSFIPFEEEISYNIDYMELAKQRLGDDKFCYEIIGDDAIPSRLPFPALFLQPILENATIHGVVKGGVSRVQISFYIINDRLYCSVSDNGPGIDATVRNKISSGARKSRGMELLQKKAATLNELYELGLIVSFEDLSNKKEVFNGTRVTISFLIGHSMNSEARQAKINKITQMSIQPLLNKDLNETT